MNDTIVDAAFLFLAVLLQVALQFFLIRKRVFRELPLFVVYSGYGLLASLASLAYSRHAPELRIPLWITEAFCETFFYFLIMMELGKNAFRHNRIAPPSRLFAILPFVLLCLLIWPAVQYQFPLNFPFIWRFALCLLQITTLLQAAAFGSLVIWSTLNKLRWPVREFRIATGMGVWTIVALCALMLHNDGYIGGTRNHWVDLMTPATCLVVLAWWVHSFWFEPSEIQAEPPYPLPSRISEGC